MGRLQKKSLEHNDYLYAVPVLEWRSRNPQRTMTLVFKITFKEIVELLNSNAFKK